VVNAEPDFGGWERGAVVARGKHADLMEDSPVYAEIYNRSSRRCRR